MEECEVKSHPRAMHYSEAEQYDVPTLPALKEKRKIGLCSIQQNALHITIHSLIARVYIDTTRSVAI